MVYNFDEIFLSDDFKRNTSKEEFIGQDADTPNIYFVIVIFPFEEFRRDIERSATEGFSHCL